MSIAPGQHRSTQGVGPAWSPLLIASHRCKGCELCVVACPKGILASDLTVVNQLGYHPIRLLDPVRCTSCALCARVCPDAVFVVFAPPRKPRREPATEA